jgi:hypothetical protein
LGIVVIIPPFMDFLTNCEDVCISHTITGALEFK